MILQKSPISEKLFYALTDIVVAGLTVHFNAVKRLAENLDFFYVNNQQCLKVS